MIALVPQGRGSYSYPDLKIHVFTGVQEFRDVSFVGGYSSLYGKTSENEKR